MTTSPISMPDNISVHNSRSVSTKWTFQDIQHLLKSTRGALPEGDMLNYTISIDHVDWDRIKFSLFTADDCKIKLLEVTEHLRRHRTLTELLTDAEKIYSIRENTFAKVNAEGGTTKNDECQQENSERNVMSVSANSLHVTESHEKPNVMEINLTGKDNETAGAVDIVDLIEETSVQNVGMQTNVDSAPVVNNTGQGVFKTFQLEEVLTQTNWSRVVVNCGERITVNKLSLRSSASTKKSSGMSGATRQTSFTSAESSNKTSLKSKPKKKLPKNPAKKKLQNKVPAITVVKRPLPAFFRFFFEVRNKLREKNPGMTAQQLAALGGEEYRKLPLSQKHRYKKEYRKELKLYEQVVKKTESNRKKNCQPTDCANKKNKSCARKNSTTKKISLNKDVEVKSRQTNKTTTLNKKQLPGSKRYYWGLVFYANQNLNKLNHTKMEEKMNVIWETWQSLEKQEKEVYVQKAIRLNYTARGKLEEKIRGTIGFNMQQ